MLIRDRMRSERLDQNTKISTEMFGDGAGRAQRSVEWRPARSTRHRLQPRRRQQEDRRRDCQNRDQGILPGIQSPY